MTFKERLSSLGFDSYTSYLAGTHWQQFKKLYRANKSLPQRCLVCNERRVELHHHDYSKLGHEEFRDVDPLCREHHEQVHTIIRERQQDVSKTHAIIREIGGVVRAVSIKPPKKSKRQRHREKKLARREHRRIMEERKSKKQLKAEIRADKNEQARRKALERLQPPMKPVTESNDVETRAAFIEQAKQTDMTAQAERLRRLRDRSRGGAASPDSATSDPDNACKDVTLAESGKKRRSGVRIPGFGKRRV